ncbi:tail fiber domain-containing protein [Pseudobdellovibrio exovorus]|uniref:Peptidase S74 domain-containing protein n=1 Tax=Pseudobdellovibrio exovorus JSS TaxID=1184267 RepID=M4VMM1_9BACT|nr:tail fiber domain-containing protein [Pseudobdellovibrio exovorus]AGH94334.1 hypothetical protein A11Q_114 [Pseudobdellovibrio exovorus JSS]
MQSRRQFLKGASRIISTLAVAQVGVYAIGAAFKNLDGSMRAYGLKMCDGHSGCLYCCAIGGSTSPGFDYNGCVNMCNQAYSDERLKTNVTYVGQENGYNIYEFEYIKDAPENLGNGQRYRGVMAQEVLKKDPSSVVLMPNGYYAVKYAHIGIELKTVPSQSSK